MMSVGLGRAEPLMECLNKVKVGIKLEAKVARIRLSKSRLMMRKKDGDCGKDIEG